MLVNEIRIGDILESEVSSRHVRVLDYPYETDSGWRCKVLHVKGQYVGQRVGGFIVGHCGYDDYSTMRYLRSTDFTPAKGLNRITL